MFWHDHISPKFEAEFLSIEVQVFDNNIEVGFGFEDSDIISYLGSNKIGVTC